MAKPWEEYAKKSQPAASGPWDEYASPGTKAMGVTDGPTPAAKEKAWNEVSSEGLAEGAVNALPAIGAGLGGAAGFFSPIPGGAIAGAGAGGLGGAALKDAINRYLRGKETNREQYYQDLGEGTVNGIMGEMGGQATAAIPGAVASKLKSLAQSEAFSALGPYARAAKRMVGKDRVGRIGQTLMDEGVVGGFPTSHSGLEKRASEAATKRSGELGQYIEDLSAKGGSQVNRKEIANSMREQMLSPHTDLPGINEKNKTIETALKQFEAGDDSVIPVLDAISKRRNLGDEINWNRLPSDDIPVPEQVNRNLYNELNQGVENTDTAVGSSPGKFRELNAKVTDLIEGGKIAQQRHAHELAKKAMLPGLGVLAGAAQGGVDTPIEDRLKHMAEYGVGGFLVNKGLMYSPQVTSPLARNSAKLLEKLSPAVKELIRTNPWAAPAIIQQELKGE